MKKLKSFFVTALAAAPPLLFADASPSLPPNPYDKHGGQVAPEFSRANAQSIYWINLMDAHAFAATWLEAGGILKDVITQEQWTAAMQATRLALGPAHARKVASHAFVTDLPFGTRGNFIVIRYNTQFARMPGATEIVTLMTEGNLSLWKVVGYRIDDRGL